MRRFVPLLILLVACTASASTPSYWFSQLQVKPDAQQAQEFWFLPGTNVTFTYANNRVYLNSGGGTISLLSSNNTWTGNNNFTGPLLWNGVQVCTNCGGAGAFVLKSGDTMTGPLTNVFGGVLTNMAWIGDSLGDFMGYGNIQDNYGDFMAAGFVNAKNGFVGRFLNGTNGFTALSMVPIPGGNILVGNGGLLSDLQSTNLIVSGDIDMQAHSLTNADLVDAISVDTLNLTSHNLQLQNMPGVNSAGYDQISIGHYAFYGDGSGLTHIYATNIVGSIPTTGLSVTQNVVLWSSSLTNQVAYTNVFANGLLIASGPFIAAHGSSIILPGGGYLLQPGGGSLLLP